MSSKHDLAFAPETDAPILYIDRTRAYYRTLGYEPYRWAHYVDVPFTPLAKPLAQSRVALITTAAPFQPEAGDQGPGAKYNAGAKFYRVYSTSTDKIPDVRISHVGYDRLHTKAEDINAYLPLAQLKEAEAAKRIGSVAPRLYGAPTNRSQRVTVEQDCPELLKLCREDHADVALLVPS